HFSIGMDLIRHLFPVESLSDMVLAEAWTSVRTFHVLASALLEDTIEDLKTHTERSSTVSGGRLNKHSAERGMQKNLAIHYRVVSDTTGQAQIGQSGFPMQMVKKFHCDFFQTQLQTRCNVSFPIRQGTPRFSRSPERVDEFIGEYAANHG